MLYGEKTQPPRLISVFFLFLLATAITWYALAQARQAGYFDRSWLVLVIPSWAVAVMVAVYWIRDQETLQANKQKYYESQIVDRISKLDFWKAVLFAHVMGMPPKKLEEYIDSVYSPNTAGVVIAQGVDRKGIWTEGMYIPLEFAYQILDAVPTGGQLPALDGHPHRGKLEAMYHLLIEAQVASGGPSKLTKLLDKRAALYILERLSNGASLEELRPTRSYVIDGQ